MSDNSAKKEKNDFLYVIGRGLLAIYLTIFYGLKVIGRENIPDGAALFCGNHTHSLDPAYMGAAVNHGRQIHFMAKREIFKKRFFAAIFYGVGAFPVNRQEADVSAIKTALKYLKSGCRVGIFPEGTRTPADDAVRAKNGALKIAERAGVPVVPVYIPRDKRIFHRNTVVIGKPYLVNPERKKLTNDEYNLLADEMMKKIRALKP